MKKPEKPKKTEVFKDVAIDPNGITVNQGVIDKIIEEKLKDPEKYSWISKEAWDEVLNNRILPKGTPGSHNHLIHYTVYNNFLGMVIDMKENKKFLLSLDDEHWRILISDVEEILEKRSSDGSFLDMKLH